MLYASPLMANADSKKQTSSYFLSAVGFFFNVRKKYEAFVIFFLLLLSHFCAG